MIEIPECNDDVCVTCSDEGRPGEVVSLGEVPFEPVLVRTATGEEHVDVTVVAPVAVGDIVLIHAGVAITRLEVAP